MRDQLVATGDATVDAYLALARDMRCPQRVLEDAERALDEAQRRDLRHDGFAGTAEARQRAEKRYDEAKRDLASGRRAEDRAAAAAEASAPHLIPLVAGEVEAIWTDFYAPRDHQSYRDRDGMPDDDTCWCDLRTGDEVHIRYEESRHTVVWQFIELGDPHPDNEDLRIAYYIERSAMRGPGCLVELAVHPQDPVGLHARSTHMTIIWKEQV